MTLKAEQERLLRIKQVLEIIAVSKSTWWAGVRDGRFPQSLKIGPRTTAWKNSDINKLANGEWLANEGGSDESTAINSPGFFISG